MRSDAVIHVRFNLNRELHRQAYEAIKHLDRSAYPTYADIIAAALISFLTNENDDMTTSEPARSELSVESAEKIAEIVARKVLSALSNTSVSLTDSDDKTSISRASKELSPQVQDSDKEKSPAQDYIPEDEIPWDFLNP